MSSFLKGLIMGFCIAAPVGPIGLLCIRRSMADGRLAGFVTGLGAATADALYGAIAALGLTAMTHLLLAHRTAIQLCGSVFLLWIGLSLIRAKTPPNENPAAAKPLNLAAAYGSTFVLTLANPATILAFIGIFAGLGLSTNSTGFIPAATLVAGVFLGSAAWWLILSTGASWLGARLATRRLHSINLASGSLIIAFALWQCVALVRP